MRGEREREKGRIQGTGFGMLIAGSEGACEGWPNLLSKICEGRESAESCEGEGEDMNPLFPGYGLTQLTKNQSDCM